MKRTNLLASALACAGAFASTPAFAQEAPQDFNLERFRLSLDRRGILDVESGEVGKHNEWELSVWLGHQDDPLVLRNLASGDRVGSLVSSRTSGSLLFSASFWERLQLGIALPLTFSQSAEDVGPVNQGAVSSFGVGDLRVVPKLALLRPGSHGVGISIIPSVTLPTAGADDYLGNDGVSFQPEIAVSYRRDRFRAGINLSYQTRKKQNFANINIEDEWRFRVGAGVLLTDSLEVDATFSLGTLGQDPFLDGQDSPSELLGGLSYYLGKRWVVFGAGGLGLANGYGTPDWRGLVGLRVGAGEPEAEPVVMLPMDSDGDGLNNSDDACPYEAENFNDFEDGDGCPDKAPPSDTDSDGIVDEEDECPTEPEDKDDFEDADGCPDLDNDKDGILDTEDDCPVVVGVEEMRGCPWPDRDGDTVVDKFDNCPDEPGTVEFQGCNKKAFVKITDSKLEILDRVFFRTNKAQILSKSFALLDNVADVLKAHPDIKLVEVEGHTDSRGRDAKNMVLSQKRADAVVAYLIKKGLAKDRLKAIGYGETSPLETNDTDEGRATNRRVEFKIAGDAKGDIKEQNSGPGEDSMDKDE